MFGVSVYQLSISWGSRRRPRGESPGPAFSPGSRSRRCRGAGRAGQRPPLSPARTTLLIRARDLSGAGDPTLRARPCRRARPYFAHTTLQACAPCPPGISLISRNPGGSRFRLVSCASPAFPVRARPAHRAPRARPAHRAPRARPAHRAPRARPAHRRADTARGGRRGRTAPAVRHAGRRPRACPASSKGSPCAGLRSIVRPRARGHTLHGRRRGQRSHAPHQP